jgi:hypothetical protein
MLGAIAIEQRAFGRFLDSDDLTPLRAAFAAATFAVARQEPALVIRMANGAKTSFYLKLNDLIESFDFAEIGRARTAGGKKTAELDPAAAHDRRPHDPWCAKRLPLKALRNAVQEAASDHRKDQRHLLVAVETQAFAGFASSEALSYLTRGFDKQFQSIWLLCGKEAFKCP